MEVNIKIIETTDEKAAVLAIRRTVFIEEQNIPEYIVNRFKRERRAAMRNAKLRLSNVKLAEITATMRNKSKQIKH